MTWQQDKSFELRTDFEISMSRPLTEVLHKVEPAAFRDDMVRTSEDLLAQFPQAPMLRRFKPPTHKPRRPAMRVESVYTVTGRGVGLEAGLLSSCDLHALGDGDRWGVRGTHGNIGAYAVADLGVCVAPEALDVPILSAIATAKRLGRLVTKYKRRTAEARSHVWRHGVGCKCDQPVIVAVVGWEP